MNVYVLKSFQDNKNFVVYGLFHETNDLQYSQNIVLHFIRYPVEVIMVSILFDML